MASMLAKFVLRLGMGKMAAALIALGKASGHAAHTM